MKKIFFIFILLLHFAAFGQQTHGVVKYKSGITYPINTLVSKDGAIYRSTTSTSAAPPSANWESVGGGISKPEIEAMGFVDGAHTVDTKLSLGEIVALGFSTGAHTVDTDTQLSDGEIGAFGYIKSYSETDPVFTAWDKDYNDLINTPTIPEGGTDDQTLSLVGNTLSIEDGNSVNINEANIGDLAHTVNTDTQLSEAEVDAFVANNGYSTGAHTIDTDTQLSQAQVGTYATNEGFIKTDTNTQLSKPDIEGMGFVDGAHTVDTDTQLSEAEVDAFVANNNYSTGAHTVDTDTQLSQAQVGTFATAEGFIKTYTETDPSFTASQASNITAQNITDLGNLSGVNSGDQDLNNISGGIKLTGGNFYLDQEDSYFGLDVGNTNPRVGFMKKSGYAGMFASANNVDFIIGQTDAISINPADVTTITTQFKINFGNGDIEAPLMSISDIDTNGSGRVMTTREWSYDKFQKNDELEIVDNTTTSITVTSSEFGTVIYCDNASAITITIPDTLTPVNGQTFSVVQWGAGQVTVQGSGATDLRSTSTTVKTLEQNSTLQFIHKGTDTDIWHVIGGLEDN